MLKVGPAVGVIDIVGDKVGLYEGVAVVGEYVGLDGATVGETVGIDGATVGGGNMEPLNVYTDCTRGPKLDWYTIVPPTKTVSVALIIRLLPGRLKILMLSNLW